MANKPDWTTDQAAENLIRWGWRWSPGGGKTTGVADGQTVVIPYSFLSAPTVGHESEFSAFDQDQRAATRLVLNMWQEVANVEFVETLYGAIRFGNNFMGFTRAGTAVNPDSSDVWFNPDWWKFRYFDMGGERLQALEHEIGHALGLAHPGDYNGTGDYDQMALYAQDTRQYSIMSYFDASKTGADHAEAYPSTPLLHDIAAIQLLYGANTSTRSTNTTYGFNTSGLGNSGTAQLYDFRINKKPIICIWDGAGTDTLDASGFSSNAYIDLNEGAFSDLGGFKKNVSIAVGAKIENAVGGSGNDTLTGNALNNELRGLDGNDTLDGGLGLTDTLIGGKGDDVYFVNKFDLVVENPNEGTDTVNSSLFNYKLLANFENLTLIGDYAIYGIGNDLRNVIKGNGEDNTLDGGKGADTLAGGRGDDTYLVDNDGEEVIEDVAGGTDLVVSSASFVLQANVENLTLEGSAVYGAGNDLDNVILGNGAANSLYGFYGNDGLYGGAGNDHLYGGAGNDHLYGGAGIDTLEGGGRR
jgi:Ca2+-binding RTX toxin-like protein